MRDRIMIVIWTALFTYLLYWGALIVWMTTMDRFWVIFFANFFSVMAYILSFQSD